LNLIQKIKGEMNIMYAEEKAKFEFLTKYLKRIVENDEYISRDELKKILIALDVEVVEK
jgi:hypothetical protein